MTRFASALLLSCALAACAKPASVEVKDVWVRDTVGRTANAAVFMTIESKAADRLVGASAPVAGKTDLMTMTMGGPGGAMGMDYVKDIALPAGQPVSLNPRGLHVWLAELKQPLKAGETFPLVLRFENAGERQVTVSVIGPADKAPAGSAG
jgi:copper(I)-binding protein